MKHFDFENLIPQPGHKRIVDCPGGLCNAELNGSIGIVRQITADATQLELISGPNRGTCHWFGVGHTRHPYHSSRDANRWSL